MIPWIESRREKMTPEECRKYDEKLRHRANIFDLSVAAVTAWTALAILVSCFAFSPKPKRGDPIPAAGAAKQYQNQMQR